MKRKGRLPGSFHLRHSRRSNGVIEACNLFLTCRKLGYEIPEDVLDVLIPTIQAARDKHLKKLLQTPGDKALEEQYNQLLLDFYVVAENQALAHDMFRNTMRDISGKKPNVDSKALHKRAIRYLDQQLLYFECPRLAMQVNKYNDQIMTDHHNRALKKLLITYVPGPLAGKYWEKLKVEVAKHRNTPNGKRRAVSLHKMIEDFLIQELPTLKRHNFTEKLQIYYAYQADP